MKYLVILTDVYSGERCAFYTKFFDPEQYSPGNEIIVIDRTHHLVSFDGVVWQDIEKDIIL